MPSEKINLTHQEVSGASVDIGIVSGITIAVTWFAVLAVYEKQTKILLPLTIQLILLLLIAIFFNDYILSAWYPSIYGSFKRKKSYQLPLYHIVGVAASVVTYLVLQYAKTLHAKSTHSADLTIEKKDQSMVNGTKPQQTKKKH